MEVEILCDADIDRIPIMVFMDAISDYVIADFEGRAVSPPRQTVGFPAGRIAFTTGGLGHVAGFRVYESFNSISRAGEDQIVAVWDTTTCSLEGVCLGSRLGAIRTGALGGIAFAALTPPSISRCALIGTGLQAETQLLAVLARRQLAEVRVYSRNRARRDAFVERMQAVAGSTCIAAFDSAEAAAEGVEAVVLATNSETPVIDPAALEQVDHIATVGPKFRDAHELPLPAVTGRLIVSDSPQQIRAQGQRHMLFAHPGQGEVRHLGEILSKGRPPVLHRSLYLSAGLSGTEVIALHAALTYRSNHV
ncbi:hypothetical protein ABQJ54_18290 [Rhodanobacter sp. Si-c]|uniref:Ornithine cyclodeaminase family protein n=1 Tax=Rhodanobacter lycopersici TaxID=3162487 RepID=A0ABV3QIN1_9GAMM